MRFRSRTLGALSLALCLGLMACGGGAEVEKSAQGVVLEVRPAEARVTIQHEDIPGMMKAMTMRFEVAEPGQLEGLKVGDAVSFRLRYAEGRYLVTSIEAR